jgi:hypothetical protein
MYYRRVRIQNLMWVFLTFSKSPFGGSFFMEINIL